MNRTLRHLSAHQVFKEIQTNGKLENVTIDENITIHQDTDIEALTISNCDINGHLIIGGRKNIHVTLKIENCFIKELSLDNLTLLSSEFLKSTINKLATSNITIRTHLTINTINTEAILLRGRDNGNGWITLQNISGKKSINSKIVINNIGCSNFSYISAGTSNYPLKMEFTDNTIHSLELKISNRKHPPITLLNNRNLNFLNVTSESKRTGVIEELIIRDYSEINKVSFDRIMVRYLSFESRYGSIKISPDFEVKTADLETLKTLRKEAKELNQNDKYLEFQRLRSRYLRSSYSRRKKYFALATLWLNDLSNASGTSASRAILFTLTTSTLLFSALLVEMDSKLHFSLSLSGMSTFWSDNFKYFPSFFNPAHRPYYLQEVMNRETFESRYNISFLAGILDTLLRIFVVYGIYQFVAAFRRFNK